MKFTRRQKGLFGFAFISCLVILSWIGLSKLYPTSNTLRYLPDRIYRIVKIVFGGDPVGSTLEPTNVPWELIVAKIFAIAILLYGGFKIIQKIFAEQYTLLLSSLRKNHYIVVGVAGKGRQLLHSLKTDKGQSGIAIEKDGEHTQISSVKKQGHAVIVGNAEEARTLLEAGVKRASHLMVFLENEQTVIEIVETVQRIYQKSNCQNLLKSYVHLRNPRLIDLVRNSGLRLTNGCIDLHFFNLHKMVARHFFSQVLLDVEASGTRLQDIRQLIFLGFGDFAKALLLQALRIFHISADNQLKVEVYSGHHEQDRIFFEEHYPKAVNIFPVTFHDFNGSFSQLIQRQELNQLDQQTLLIAAYDDDRRNLDNALELLNMTRNLSFPIYTLNSEGKGLRVLIKQTAETARLKFFGSAEETGSLEFITGEMQDALARAIHDDYQKKIVGVSSESSSYTSNWNKLSEDAKDASRAQADHIPFKLALVNKPLRPVPQLGLQFSATEVEQLAIIEHNRWMAHRYLNGWDFGEVRDDTLKLHPSLVPWVALSEGEKQKDRDTVLRIPDLLQ